MCLNVWEKLQFMQFMKACAKLSVLGLFLACLIISVLLQEMCWNTKHSRFLLLGPHMAVIDT